MWLTLRNIVLDTEARHKVDRADHSLYIKFKNRSTTLHKLGIRYEWKNIKKSKKMVITKVRTVIALWGKEGNYNREGTTEGLLGGQQCSVSQLGWHFTGLCFLICLENILSVSCPLL